MSKPLPALALAAAALALAGRAAAADPPWHVGLSLGYAALLGGSTWNGFSGAAHLGYAINDTFMLIAQVEAADHPSAGVTLVSGGVGATYLLDVLEWVPWAGAEVGPAAFVGGAACGTTLGEACPSLRLDLAVPFGLDYRVSKSFTVGLGGRYQMLVLGASMWSALSVGAQAEYVWGR